MNKNDFIKNLDSKDIIQVIEKNGTRELIFTEKNSVSSIETRHHHNNLMFNSLDDFVESVNSKSKDDVIYNFAQNKIFFIQEVKMELEKKELKVHAFVPIATEELTYWSRQREENLKKFLNKLSLVADKDTVRGIRLMFAEFEIGEKTDARNEAVIVKTIKNTLKVLPEVLTISFNPYMFIEDFKIEIEIYLDWEIDNNGFKSIKWDFESSLIKHLFYEHLNSEVDIDFIIGDFTPVNEKYLNVTENGECKEEKKEGFSANIEIEKN